MKKNVLIFLLLIQGVNLFAQKQTFENPETFLADLRVYMKIALSDQDIVNTLDTFQINWESGKIEEGYKFGIILTSNIMANRNAKPQTHFYYYLKTINGFTENQKLDDYMEWEVGLIELLDGQYELMSKIATYLEFSAGFINENILTQSPSIAWKSNSTDFFLINDVENKVMTVQLSTFDLLCYSKTDSFEILQTKGIFYPVENKFVGYGGMMTWKRIGLSEDSIYVIVQDYEIDMSVGAFQAENVTITNKYYLEKDELGSFQDKLMSTTSLKDPTFPKFYSYNDDITIKNIVPNINYKGSFNMEGTTFLGKGSDENFAYLNIFLEDFSFITIASKTFNFVEKEISANNAFASIKIADNDSIYHYELGFEYDKTTNVCYFNRIGLSLTESPFIDTYHNLNIYSGQIKWTYGDSLLYVYTSPKTALKSAVFESDEYFSMAKYNALQGYETVNPLVTLKQFFMSQATDKFYASTYTAYINKEQKRNLTEDQVHQQLYNLAKEGFIEYNPITRYAEIQQKLYNFIGNKTGKKDYDGIEITSELEGYYGVNGIISLNTLKLDIINPKPLALSEVRRVGVFADTITVAEGKNMTFNGHLRSGLTDFYGKDFKFDYEGFSIQSNNIDSLTMIAQSDSVNEKGYYDPVPIASTVEDLSGVLYIDDPTNKSGVKEMEGYPKFDSDDKSYVYYDKIDSAKYNREKFYAEIYDMKLDNMNALTKKSIDSQGKFVSGLFPDFEVVFSLQDDASLGFIKEDTVSGYEIFDGKYYGFVKLDNSGLSGQGTIKYLTTTAKSKDFTFYPDSVTGITQELTIDGLTKDKIGTVPLTEDEYPQAFAENSFFHWKPFENKIIVTSLANGIYMFDKEAVLNGQLDISTTGLTGSGDLMFVDGNLTSQTYDFKNSTLTCDTTAFNIQNITGKDLPFKTENVHAFIDVDAKKGTFTANSDSCKIIFPVNQYSCVMDHFTWDIGRSSIDIGAGIAGADKKLLATTVEQRDSLRNSLPEDQKKNVRLTGTWFTSLNEKQDSLTFFSGSSSYDIKENLITAKNVPVVEVADASIYPSDYLYIEKKAFLRPLYDCRIVATRDSQFHTIRNASAYITSKHNYGGSGEYTYQYNTQRFYLDTIYVDSIFQTLAFAKILEKDSFFLSPYFTFYGDIALTANDKFLDFSGYSSIINDCPGIVSEGLKFSNHINPDSVYIPLEQQITNKNKRQLDAGFYMTKLSPKIYTAFVSPLENLVSDEPIITVGGYLFFDTKDNYYKIANLDKLKNIDKQGSYISLHKNYCFAYAEGEIDLNADLGEVKIKTFGNVLNKIYEKQIVFNNILGINFYFLNRNIKLISDQLIENFYLEPINTSTNSFSRNLTNWVGEDRANTLFEEILYFGQFDKVPTEFESFTIVFSDLKMNWDTLTTSYRSIGQLGIANIGNEQINRYTNGYVEIKKRKPDGDNSMDEIAIFIETNEAEWYYFFYRGETMSAVSSNTDFNNNIINAKSKELKIQNYEILPGNKQNALDFRRTFTEGVSVDIDNDVVEDFGDDGKIKPTIKKDIIRDSTAIKDIKMEEIINPENKKNEEIIDTIIPEDKKNEEIKIEDTIIPEDKEIKTEDVIIPDGTMKEEEKKDEIIVPEGTEETEETAPKEGE